MLKITQQQFDRLREEKTKEFCHLALNYIDDLYPNALSFLDQKDDQIEWIYDVVTTAHSYELDTEEEIYSYLRAALTFDEDFHTESWAKEVLTLSVSPSNKALLLDDAVTIQLEKQANEIEKKNNALLKTKIEQYAREKAQYVLSFSSFYGLGLKKLEESTQWVRNMGQQAKSDDITENPHLDAYLEVAMRFGLDFNKTAWAKNILESNDTIDNKVQALLRYLSANYGNTHA